MTQIVMVLMIHTQLSLMLNMVITSIMINQQILLEMVGSSKVGIPLLEQNGISEKMLSQVILSYMLVGQNLKLKTVS